jgi:hypothetical protein
VNVTFSGKPERQQAWAKACLASVCHLRATKDSHAGGSGLCCLGEPAGRAVSISGGPGNRPPLVLPAQQPVLSAPGIGSALA